MHSFSCSIRYFLTNFWALHSIFYRLKPILEIFLIMTALCSLLPYFMAEFFIHVLWHCRYGIAAATAFMYICFALT